MALDGKPLAVARAPGVLGLGAASALAWLVGARAFVSTGRTVDQLPASGSLVLRGPAAARPAPAVATPAQTERRATQGSFSASLPSAAFGALLLGVAAARRRKACATARRVNWQQIDTLTIDDVPGWFRPKISIGMSRRGALSKDIRAKLEDTYFLMAFSKDGMDCDSLRQARALFPESVTVRGLKNSLVKKAMEGTEWEDFGTALKGSLMYVFVKDDTDLKPTVQAYLKLEKTYNRVEKLAKVYENLKAKNAVNFDMVPLVGGCLRDEWKLIGPEDFVKLKDFPTKTELIARIAGSIKQVTQKIAVGVKQVPQKLAIGTKKVVEKMEEDGKATVGDVVA